jgi:hypothetical protein
VVKEMSQEEMKAKMDRGDDFSRSPSGTPPTSPEPHRAFYFALEGLVDRFVYLHYGLAPAAREALRSPRSRHRRAYG